MKNVLTWIGTAYALAWLVVVGFQPDLWPIALLGFIQNIAFTFVSRGRNSGSLGYHLLASVFSNGLYAALLFTSVDVIAQAKSSPAWFLMVYTLATMSGGIFAHWLALRVERGKGRSVQDDKFAALARRVALIEGRMGSPYLEAIREMELSNGVTVRVWGKFEDSDRIKEKIDEMLSNQSTFSEPEYEMARRLCEQSGANAVQVSIDTLKDRVLHPLRARRTGVVYYREWP